MNRQNKRRSQTFAGASVLGQSKDNKLKFEDYDLGQQNEVLLKLKDISDYEKINVKFQEESKIQEAFHKDSV